MSYLAPGVTVTTVFEAAAATPVIPSLKPCAIGEHYYVVKKAFAGNIEASTSSALPYPSLPKSVNDPNTDLSVDITGIPPVVTIILSDGTEVDITDRCTITATTITTPVFTDDYNGTPYTGAVYVDYRALYDKYTGSAQQMLSASSVADLTTLFGATGFGYENPLGFAMFMGLLHSGRTVYGAAIGDPIDSYSGAISDETAAYLQALDTLALEDVHSLVPLTHSDAVLSTVRGHCNTYSAPLMKKPRRMVFAPEFNDLWAVRQHNEYEVYWPIKADAVAGQTVLNDGTDPGVEETTIGHSFTITEGQNTYEIIRVAAGVGDDFGVYGIRGVTVDSDTEALTLGGEAFTVGYAIDGANQRQIYALLPSSAFRPTTNRVRVGDKVGFGGAPLTSVGAILFPGFANNEFLVQIEWTHATNFPAATLIDSQPITFYRELTGKNRVDGLRDMGQALADERVTLVAPDTVGIETGGEKRDLPSYYAAFQLATEFTEAGQSPAGADPGKNGLTGIRAPYTAVFESTGFFSDTELDTAAGGGVTWLVHKQPGQSLYTRSTITTDPSTTAKRQAILGYERDHLHEALQATFTPLIRSARIDDTLINTLALTLAAIESELAAPNSPRRTWRALSLDALEEDPDDPSAVNMSISGTHLYVFERLNITLVITR